jgi:hypothetical protein
MISHANRRSIRTVVRHLSRADHFNKLAKCCPRAHRHTFYELKDRAIDRAIGHNPDEFKVDSISHGFEPILGVTHLPSGRRFHVRPYRQAYATQVALHRFATDEDYHYRFLRYADDRQQHSLSPRSAALVTGGAA